MAQVDLDSWRPTRRDAYSAYLSFAQRAEENVWVRFNNFLLFGSILVVAWSAIYSQPAPRHDHSQLVMVSMSILGIFSGLAWWRLEYRGRKYVNRFFEEGKKLEADAEPDCKAFQQVLETRSEFLLHSLGSYYVLVFTTVLFTALYGVLLFASVC